MANISKITVNSTDYDVKDALSRKHLSWYGTCTSEASATTKVVTCANYTLETGSTIDVKFSNTNSGAVASLKLNVNGTGAKAIKYKGTNIPSADIIEAGSVLSFVYDGVNYEIVGGIGTSIDSVTGVKGNSESTYRTGNVNLTAANVGAVAVAQGSGNAGKFLVVNSSGNVEPVAMSSWQGGDY